MNYEEGYMMQKVVDWSLLNDGMTIPVSQYQPSSMTFPPCGIPRKFSSAPFKKQMQKKLLSKLTEVI